MKEQITKLKDDVIKCRHAVSQITYPEFGKKQPIFLAQLGDEQHDKHKRDYSECDALEARIEQLKEDL